MLKNLKKSLRILGHLPMCCCESVKMYCDLASISLKFTHCLLKLLASTKTNKHFLSLSLLFSTITISSSYSLFYSSLYSIVLFLVFYSSLLFSILLFLSLLPFFSILLFFSLLSHLDAFSAPFAYLLLAERSHPNSHLRSHADCIKR